MADRAFKLGTYRRGREPKFSGIILDDGVIAIAAAYDAWRGAGGTIELADPHSIYGLLQEWDKAFPALQEIVDFVLRTGIADQRLAKYVYAESELHSLAPVQRPGKMLYAAANFASHVKEMRDANFTGGSFDTKRDFMGEKAKARPYLFLKASSTLCGAFDDIIAPRDWLKLDWEGEMALAIGSPGRRIRAENATQHIAGFMTTNDISCRDLQFREDRQTIRSDWLGGKSHDTFAPMGPYFVPKQFVKDHNDLAIKLWVNGELKQDGRTSEFIFNAEEQIEYVSRMLSVEPGDIFATGTCGGVGQGTNTFLKVGDVVETEIEGLGRQRNRIVEDR